MESPRKRPSKSGTTLTMKRARLTGKGVSSASRVDGLWGSKATTELMSTAPVDVSLPIQLAAMNLYDVSQTPVLATGQGRSQTSVLSGGLVGLGNFALLDVFQKPFWGIGLKNADNAEQIKLREASAAQNTIDKGLCEADACDDSVQGPQEGPVLKRIRKFVSDFPIVFWAKELAEYFLREYTRLDGRGDALLMDKCPECGKEGSPEYRCVDCHGANLCRDCLVHWHRYNPLHVMEFFNGDFYERVSASDLGMRIQLVHPPGKVCFMRELKHKDDFTIIHTNGIHHIRVDYCNCELGQHIPEHIQLLRCRLWPATCDNPETATTCSALDLFHRLTLYGRLNGYDFHRAMVAASDGALIRGLADVRQQLMVCIHQFRHIVMFKRAGRAHEPGGIAGTAPGACAVRCVACPHEDLNLPTDYMLRPFRWLYRVYLSVDANFRLSNKLTRSTTKTDPCLTNGKAYMAPPDDYNDHICETEGVFVESPSDCNRFNAVGQANQKGAQGAVRSTGIAGCFCARHEMVQGLGVAPLRKGERYVSMDYVVCGAMSLIRAPEVVISYDIACQWHKNLRKRLSGIPHHRKVWKGANTLLSLHAGQLVSFVVPKFHLYAHKLACRVRFALGWLCGAAQVDGEACERVWSGINPAASSLREMGPGTQHDVMDDMCGSLNWEKVCGIADVIVARVKRALSQATKQSAIFTELDELIREEDPTRYKAARTRVQVWEEEACDYSKSPSTLCPYGTEKNSMTVAQIKLEAAQARTQATDRTADANLGGRITDDAEQMQFLLRGLDIEDDRARIENKDDGDEGGTVRQETSWNQTLNSLLRDINAFRQVQEHLMPVAYAAFTGAERFPERKAALTVKLHMPSDPPSGTTAAPDLVELEAKLRWASMTDALDNLRHQLRLRGCLNKFKLANITGQRKNTRARAAQDAIDANVRKAANSYRRHRAAYLKLMGTGDWETTMQELLDSDCRGLGDRLIEQMERMSEEKVRLFLQGRRGADSSGETKHDLPWIWYKVSVDSCFEITDDLMVEWAKSRARAQRWIEEVRLLDEEMRRVVASSESIARVWDSRQHPQDTISIPENFSWASDPAWADGVRAYACKQAWIRRSQAALWHGKLAQYREAARAFLAVHTAEGISIAPVVLLPQGPPVRGEPPADAEDP